MRETVNPLLLQVLHRRRMLRGARWSAVAWVFFGGLHIVAWWIAFEHTPAGWPQGSLDAAVWPLLLLATAAFVSLLVYAARWLLAPSDPQVYDWLEHQSPRGPVSPDELESVGSATATDPESSGDQEPKIVRAHA